MSKIGQVKNVSIFTDLTSSLCNWDQNINLGFSPDEVRVRQITYHGPATSDGAFLIWSSLTNDYIGSFSVYEETGAVSNNCNLTPNTVIRCAPNSVQNNLRFQLFSINGSGNPVATTVLDGTLIINLDFIRYT